MEVRVTPIQLAGSGRSTTVGGEESQGVQGGRRVIQ